MNYSESNSYHILARYYDAFQNNEATLALRDVILTDLSRFLIRDNQEAPILLGDLGCGSGSLAMTLLDENVQITAVDLSAEMLSEFSKKLNALHESQGRVQLIEADISQYRFSEAQDVLLAMTDSLNHLTAEQMLDLFSLAAENLRSGGLFIFDLLQRDFLAKERGTECFFAELGDDASAPTLSMIWENEWIEEEALAISHLTFFERVDGCGQYQRFTDEITEYYHDLKSVENVWWGHFECVEIRDTEERRYFVLRRL